MKISATIITLNEERNLPRALESLIPVDEVIVVDSGSTDRTLEIARRYGARVIEHAWPGFAQQKNYAAAQASHDWILSLDADEALSENLQAEILQLKQSGLELPASGQKAALARMPAGYRFPRLAQYMGRWILHSGWYPDSKVRLYDRRRAHWVGEYVHESVSVDGPVDSLAGRLHHFTCSSLSEHIRTLDRYTTLAAEELRAHQVRAGFGRLLFSPPAAFFRSYFIKQGFRDGYQGFLIAAMAAWYVFLKYAKTR
jgi:glycosyltransferase involved in cell wall biosynthesis